MYVVFYQESALNIVKKLEILELGKSKGAAVNPSVPASLLRESADRKVKIINNYAFLNYYYSLVIS